MSSAIFKTLMATILALGLSAAVVGQSDEAFAESGSDSQAMKHDKSASQSAGQIDSTKEKADFLKSWTSAEKPGQSFASYASNGLTLLDGALNSVIEDARQQPIGGGPDEASDESQQKSQQAMEQIDQHQKKLSKISKELSKNADITEHPAQFYDAATSVSEMFSSLQQARFPKLEGDVKKVSDAVDKLAVDKPLAAQSKDIERFFSTSSDVINKMSKELEQSSAVGGGPEESQETSDQEDSQMEPQDSQPANPDMPSDTQ